MSSSATRTVSAGEAASIAPGAISLCLRTIGQGQAMGDEPSRAPTPGPDKGETDSPATSESSGKPPSTDGPARGGPDTPSTPDGHARKPESAPVGTPAQEPSAPGADGPSPADGDDRPYWKRAEDE